MDCQITGYLAIGTALLDVEISVISGTCRFIQFLCQVDLRKMDGKRC